MLNGVIWELWQEARAQLKLPPAKNDMDSQRFIQAATSALSDVNFYPAPLVFQLDSFEEVKASVFQVTRSPGKNMVYLGCLLLTLGILQCSICQREESGSEAYLMGSNYLLCRHPEKHWILKKSLKNIRKIFNNGN